MISRFMAVSFAVAVILGLAGIAPPEDQTEPAKAPSEEKTTTKGEEKAGTTDGKAEDTTKKKEDTAKGKTKKGASDKSSPSEVKLEKATFGGGCFWSIEAIFERIPGVKSAVSGFAGGNVPRPSYEMVCTGQTGHAESVQVTYDPEVVSYDQLLKVFWSAHDPTTLNSQGEDFGPQYRSVIFYHTEAQRLAALKSYNKLTDAGAFSNPIVTELVPMTRFYPAERYHQDYYRKHRTNEYCQMIIAPKLKKLGLLRTK